MEVVVGSAYKNPVCMGILVVGGIFVGRQATTANGFENDCSA